MTFYILEPASNDEILQIKAANNDFLQVYTAKNDSICTRISKNKHFYRYNLNNITHLG